MSHLSPQECTAGISRAALHARIAEYNQGGNGNGAKPAASNKFDAKPIAVETSPIRSIGDSTVEHPVIETPYRRLSVLESRDESILVRDASFVGSKCDVQLIHLERHEADVLAQVLAKLAAEQTLSELAEEAAHHPDPEKPRKRVRA